MPASAETVRNALVVFICFPPGGSAPDAVLRSWREAEGDIEAGGEFARA
jgi:hypothetical protein